MWTIRIMPERELPPHLWRTTASVNQLIRTNDRLMVCYAVAAGIMSEGQACAHLGIDRVTFREIYAAAEQWAEEAERNLTERRIAADQAAGPPDSEPGGAGPSQPPPP